METDTTSEYSKYMECMLMWLNRSNVTLFRLNILAQKNKIEKKKRKYSFFSLDVCQNTQHEL